MVKSPKIINFTWVKLSTGHERFALSFADCYRWSVCLKSTHNYHCILDKNISGLEGGWVWLAASSGRYRTKDKWQIACVALRDSDGTIMSNSGPHSQAIQFCRRFDKNNSDLPSSTLCYGDCLAFQQNSLVHSFRVCRSATVVLWQRPYYMQISSHSQVSSDRQLENVRGKLCLHR